MGKFADLTGMTFSRWAVLELDGKRGAQRYWKCACICGKTKNVCGASLKSGASRSCGCLIGDSRRAKTFDLIGKRFGRLTVISLNDFNGGNARWLCVCDCGKEKIIIGRSLTKGMTTSCGCYGDEQRKKATFIDLTGERFGKLVVNHFSYSIGTNYLWNCTCDCGNTKDINKSSLRRGLTNSCGCEQGHSLPEGESRARALFSSYKSNAKRRGIEFGIDIGEFKMITKLNCHYCNKEPSQISSDKKANGAYIYNGIDRLNSKKGYFSDNIVPCCQICNWRKSNASEKDFIDWIDSVYINVHKKDINNE